MCQTLFLFLSQNLTSAGGRLGKTKTIFLLADKGGVIIATFWVAIKSCDPWLPNTPSFLHNCIWCWPFSSSEYTGNHVYKYHAKVYHYEQYMVLTLFSSWKQPQSCIFIPLEGTFKCHPYEQLSAMYTLKLYPMFLNVRII